MKFLRKSEIFVPVTQIQVKNKSDMTFTCYTNVKGNVDHANDITMNGAYQKSINYHKAHDSMPKMFWNHNNFLPPVGGWEHMEEDEKGLFKEGRMLDTDRGIEIFKAMQIKGGIDRFSIGYGVIEEKWNGKHNELHDIHIIESSPVNFACNDLSTLQDIRKSLHDGGVLSKSDLRHLLQSTEVGLSKREIDRITTDYNPSKSDEGIILEIGSILANSSFCK